MMCDIAKEHDLFIIGDEAYREFVYGGEPLQSFGEFADAAENVIVIDTVSKRFSACGARIGCHPDPQPGAAGRGHEVLPGASVRRHARSDRFCRSVSRRPGVFRRCARRVQAPPRHRRAQAALRSPASSASARKGAFYLMAALPVDDADKFQQWLLEEFEDNGDTVMFAPGEPFYATPGKGKNEIRIAYVLKQEDLERAMDLLALGIKAYNEKNK